MLTAAMDCTRKTRIMYLAYLSYDQLEEYLPLLLNNEMLRFDKTKRIYCTTEKGSNFVKKYASLKL